MCFCCRLGFPRMSTGVYRSQKKRRRWENGRVGAHAPHGKQHRHRHEPRAWRGSRGWRRSGCWRSSRRRWTSSTSSAASHPTSSPTATSSLSSSAMRCGLLAHTTAGHGHRHSPWLLPRLACGPPGLSSLSLPRLLVSRGLPVALGGSRFASVHGEATHIVNALSCSVRGCLLVGRR